MVFGMNFTENLLKSLSGKHLLKHPFYQAWTEGKLTQEDLQHYSAQYFHHVDAFPRYISATHSLCKDIKARQVLLDNLTDEEKGDEHHPELWLRFAEGVGQTREGVHNAELLPETCELVDTFFELSRSSFAEGLGALFAYENQVPEVASTKIEGLKKWYGIESERATQFFSVHLEADVWHTQAVAEIMNALPEEEKAKAEKAAEKAASALWKFLDGVERTRVQAA